VIHILMVIGLCDGYHDDAAYDRLIAGLTRSHPADIFLPPLFAVDHILTRGATATPVRTLPLPGSDHRALIAEIAMQP
jgi:endonuclease/exonuclease/phosphatase (EEP) superfamily protein YafD